MTLPWYLANVEIGWEMMLENFCNLFEAALWDARRFEGCYYTAIRKRDAALNRYRHWDTPSERARHAASCAKERAA